MTHVVRRKQQQYFSAMDRAAEVVTSLSRNSLNVDEFHEHFKQLIQKLDELKTQLYDRVAKLSEGVLSLDGKVTIQTAAIDSGLEKLRDGGTELDNFLQKLSNDQTAVLRTLSGLFEKAEIGALFTRLQRTIEEEARNLGATLEAQASTIALQARPASVDFGQLARQLETNARALEKLDSSMTGLAASLQSMRPPATRLEPPSTPSAQSRASGVRFMGMITLAGLSGSVLTLFFQRALQ
jgi:ABC-type transporter Mla subunit MlaD